MVTNEQIEALELEINGTDMPLTYQCRIARGAIGYRASDAAVAVAREKVAAAINARRGGGR